MKTKGTSVHSYRKTIDKERGSKPSSLIYIFYTILHYYNKLFPHYFYRTKKQINETSRIKTELSVPPTEVILSEF